MAAARRIGYPCVIKPARRQPRPGRRPRPPRRGRAVRAAWPETVRQSRGGDVVVESFITGRDYRCLVIGGKLAAVAERVPAASPATASGRSASSSSAPTATPDAASATRRS